MSGIIKYILLVFLLVGVWGSVSAGEPDRRVRKPVFLILNSYHQGFLWTDAIVKSFTEEVIREAESPVFYIEYMDAKRFVGKDFNEHYRLYLEHKFSGIKPDVIVTTDDAAFTFVLKNRDKLFAGVPLVFCGVNNVENATAGHRNTTGVIETLDIEDNIRLIMELFPTTVEIVCVSDGTPTGLATRARVEAVHKEFPKVRFEYFNGEDLSMSELLGKLRKLPERSVVIAPAWYQDRLGKAFLNTESYPIIAENSPVAVFVTSAANMGLGVFGGKVNSGEIQGKKAAELAIKVLRSGGYTPKVSAGSNNAFIFDKQQLMRFGVTEDRLPLGSIITNRPFSFYKEYRYLVWSVAAVFVSMSALIFFLAINVKKRHVVENALRLKQEILREQKNKLRVTLSSIGEGVIATDINGNIQQINPVAEKLTGWEGGLALGRLLDDVVKTIHAITKEDLPSLIHEAISSGRPASQNNMALLVSREGQEYRIADTATPIIDDQEVTVGGVLVFRDITDETEVQEQLRQSQKMDAIGQLAGGIAHDFNNMLGGIISAADLAEINIKKGKDPSQFVKIILEAAQRAASLTKKLLAFSRQQPKASTPVDVNRILKDSIDLLGSTIDKRIRLHPAISEGQLSIIGDPSQLQNSFMNLLINASQAMPEGGDIYISSEPIEIDAIYCNLSAFEVSPGNYVKVEIRDTGSGIPQENIDKIFEPFFTTKEVGKGTGLGLAAVLGTVEQHKGAITVYSEPGEGTSFHILLPLTEQAPRQEVAVEEHDYAGKGVVLLVDDEEVMRLTGKAILEEFGYEVLLATNGIEALEVFTEKADEIDLVILDMVMPQMNGRDCFHKIREVREDTRVIISSGFSREEEMVSLKGAGLCGFIHKPFRASDLAVAVKGALRG